MSGFAQLGFNIVEVDSFEDIPLEYFSRESIPIGGLGFVNNFIDKLGIDKPESLDYPECLNEYLGRNTFISTIDEIATKTELYPIFIKPYSEEKLFTGKVINNIKDLIGCRPTENIKVVCSELVDFVVEYRGYVQFNRLVDCRYYKGDFKKSIDYTVVEKAIKDFKEEGNPFDAYSIDFGLTSDGKTLLVECNDAYSLGSYGLLPINYAKFLLTKWLQIVELPHNFYLTILKK